MAKLDVGLGKIGNCCCVCWCLIGNALATTSKTPRNAKVDVKSFIMNTTSLDDYLTLIEDPERDETDDREGGYGEKSRFQAG